MSRHKKPHHRTDHEPRHNRPRSKLMEFLFAGFVVIVVILVAVWLFNKFFYP